MKYIALKNAMIAWTPKWLGKPLGRTVAVCKHPDNGQLADLRLWCKFTNGTPKGPYPQKEAGETWLKLRMMVEAWHIACRDGVPLTDIHAALSSIPEYKDLLSDDFYCAGIGKEWIDLTEDFPLTKEA